MTGRHRVFKSTVSALSGGIQLWPGVTAHPRRLTSTCLVGRGSLGVRIIDAPLPGSFQLTAPFPRQAGGSCAARSCADCLSPQIEFQRGSSRVSLREIRFGARPPPLAVSPPSAPSSGPSPPFSFRPHIRVEVFRGAAPRCARRVGDMKRH